jgi:hypothetical protein
MWPLLFTLLTGGHSQAFYEKEPNQQTCELDYKTTKLNMIDAHCVHVDTDHPLVS